MTNPRAFTRLDGRQVFDGHVISVHVDRFRFDADGEEVEREVVRHPGAAAIVAHDGTDLFLVRQPRPSVGDPDVLELPAGLLDKDGEPPEVTAGRELTEEIGKAAGHIEHLHSFWSSVGSLDEEVHVFLATDLSDAEADSGENERIEIVRWPLAELDEAIAQTRDAKTLIGMLLLRERLRDPDAVGRREAGRRLLAAPAPDQEREPDWEIVKREMREGRGAGRT